MASERQPQPKRGVLAVPPPNTVDDYITALLPETVCCGTMRIAIQNTLIIAASDGWYYICGQHGCHFIAICPWCCKSLVTDEEMRVAFDTNG